MRVVAILQARMNSTRLPGKVMLPLGGKPMVQNIVERVRRSRAIHELCVAIPPGDHDGFYPLSVATGCNILEPAVPENDLVGRYLAVANEFKSCDLIVRVPCDNS